MSKKQANEEQIQKYVEIELRKMERRRKLLRLSSTLIAIGCLGYFIFYTYQSKQNQLKNDGLASMKESSFNYGFDVEEEEGPLFSLIQKDENTPEILEEYKKMYNLNKRLIGWLKIADIGIDNPVVQTNNNEFYLDHDFYQNKDQNGTLFMDKDCDVLKPSTNWIIYGHHMKNGKMFGNLIKYESEDYYKKHPTFTFDTIYEKGTYEIMYVFRSKVYSEEDIVFKYYQFIDALSEQEFNSYMNEMAAMSLYDTGVTAKYTDQLLTLSTCDYYTDAGRFVIVAKKKSN